MPWLEAIARESLLLFRDCALHAVSLFSVRRTQKNDCEENNFCPFFGFAIEKHRMSDNTRTSERTFVVNSNRDLEQDENESRVELLPPYYNEIESFDNTEAYPDMELVVEGMPKPLLLHRKILAAASGHFKTMLKERRSSRLEWPYDTNKETDREVLVKALRFCYGETLSIGTKNGECCGMIATLSRLQVTCLDDVMTLLINFAMDEAKRNIETGVELLKECTHYKECCGSNPLSLDKRLAAIVLTKDNMHAHYKDVVDNCLMVLPPEYLMVSEYGESHTRWSEFCLKAKYVRLYSKELSMEEKDALVSKCDWSTLNSHELRELRLTGIINKDELLEAHEKALERCEFENEQANEMIRMMQKKMEDKVNEFEKTKEICAKEAEEWKKRAEKAENERDEEGKRARKAESEREEFRKRAEREEKENQEMVKQVREAEKEREMRGEDLEEYKKRAEKAEEEKEKYMNSAETLETFLQGFCLHDTYIHLNNNA